MREDSPVSEQMEICVIQVSQWFDEGGNVRYGIKTRGDVTVSTWIGLLEMAKHDMLIANKEEQ